MLNNYKAWWLLLFIQCTMVALVLGAYVGMKSNIVSMKTELRLMSVRLRALEEKAESPRSQVGSGRVSVDALAREVADPSRGLPPDRANRPDASVDSTRSPGHESPICVNKMTHLVFSCERANKCLGANNFDGAYFKGIRAKLALADADTMMICDEKGTDGSPPPSEGRNTPAP